MHSLRAVSCALVLAVASPAHAATLLAHREMMTNGITLLVAERPAIPIAVVRVYLRAGSAFDPPEAPGLANLTAELLTRGTGKRSGPDLDRAIEFVGGSLEAEAGRDGTTVTLSVLKKDLSLGLDFLAEVLLQPAFLEDELKRKVQEIQTALKREEESPETVAVRELARLLYPGHPYAHPTAGTIESVGQITRDQVIRFYREHYRPDAAIIAAVGAVTREEIRRELVARLALWTAPSGVRPSVGPAPAQPPVVQRTIARPLTQATVYLGRPAIRQDHPDYFPLTVANYVLGGGSASRLYTRVREERGLAYAVYSLVSPARYGASAVVSLQTRLDGVDEAVRLAKEEMARLATAPVEPREIELAKSYLIGSFPLRLDTSAKVAGLLVAIEENGLGLDYAERFKAGVAKVTAADVQRVAARYLDPATFSSVTVGPSP